MIGASRSLRIRMVVLFGLLIVAIAGFMAVFLPGRIEDQLRGAIERRARTIAQVLASAVEPAVEFDDPDHARTTLQWLDTLGDAQFAVVDSGTARLAGWHEERALGFDPLPGACLTREARLLWARMSMERQAAKRIAKRRVSPEGQEGVRAFLERKKPGWAE